MDQLLQRAFYLHQLTAARDWLVQNALALSIGTIGQIIVAGGTFLLARTLAPRLQGLLAKTAKGRFELQIEHATRTLAPLTLPIVWLALLWLLAVIASKALLPLQLLNIVVSLLTAWVVIRFTAALVRNPTWSRFVAVAVWVIAALNIVHLLAPAMALLDSAALNLGGLRISALTVVKAALSLAFLLWLATLSGRVLERQVTTLTGLSPSLQVLIVKLMKILLTVFAVIIALRMVGIDLTALTVLTGAIGVGVGFGLQKSVANFVSGLTILLDKSIKPGDVLAIGQTYGRVESLGARYVSIITRDGTEFLIPNEDLVTQQVINWSFSSKTIRLRVPIGISYKADVRQAIALCIAAAGAVKRVLRHPQPVCLLMGFGDSAVDLELRFWIEDPMNGLSNVKSEVLLHVWDSFHEHGIELPYPQRDVNFRSPLEVTVKSDAISDQIPRG
jgi:small-conductance mechanosensitive channel